MIIGEVIKVEKVESPTQKQIDVLHERLLKDIAACFNDHKAALGWGEKKLVFI